MSINKQCYLCAGRGLENYPGSVRDRAGLTLKRCKACGLVFLSSFDHIQNSVYKNPSTHRGRMDMAAWLKESRYDDARRVNYCLKLSRGKRVLDYGCGAGGFLIQLKDIAKSVAGIDIEKGLTGHLSSHGIKFAEWNLGLRPGVPFKETFDLITMFHILEHLSEPVTILKKLKKLLAPRGVILIEVPNLDDALLKLYKCEAFSHFHWSFHLFLYNKETLARLFQKIGAKINYIRYVQRYPLSNHLYWLAMKKPGGHKEWAFLNSEPLSREYEKQLVSLGMTDTLMASISFS